jgi:hypothetical protein
MAPFSKKILGHFYPTPAKALSSFLLERLREKFTF